MQQFQIQLTTGPQALNNGGGGAARGSAAAGPVGGINNNSGGTGPAITGNGGSGGSYTYGGPSGVRASVACDACRKRKVKCTVVHPQHAGGGSVLNVGYGSPDSGPPPRVCVRCSRLGIECSWKDEKKSKPKMSTGKSSSSSAATPTSASGTQGLEVVFESYPAVNGYVLRSSFWLIFRPLNSRLLMRNPALLLRFSPFLIDAPSIFWRLSLVVFYLAHKPQGLLWQIALRHRADPLQSIAGRPTQLRAHALPHILPLQLRLLRYIQDPAINILSCQVCRKDSILFPFHFSGSPPISPPSAKSGLHIASFWGPMGDLSVGLPPDPLGFSPLMSYAMTAAFPPT